MSYYILLIWLLVAFIVPQLFWQPGTINVLLYPLAELICTGGLQVYISLFLHKNILVLAVPLLTVGYFIHKENLWLIIIFFALLVPLASLAIPGGPKTDILLAILQNLLMLALGYIFRRMLDAHIKVKQLLRDNKRQYQLIQEQNRMLVAHAEQVEQLTQLEERNRMAREVVVVIGSPHKGRTLEIVNKLEQSLKEIDNISFEYVFLRDVDLKQCRGCGVCLERGEEFCSLKDDRTTGSGL